VIITFGSNEIKIRWGEYDTDETKQIILCLVELARLLVMLSERTRMEGK